MTCSATTAENSPLSAASCRTPTSEPAISPRTSTVSALGTPAGESDQDLRQLLGQRQPGPDVLRDGAAGLHVDRVGHELAPQRELDRMGHRRSGLLLRLGGAGPEMRRHHDVRQAEQRRTRRRLRDEDVDAGAAEMPAPDRLGQRVLVDESTAGRVDEHGAGSHGGQLLLAEQPHGLRASWAGGR